MKKDPPMEAKVLLDAVQTVMQAAPQELSWLVMRSFAGTFGSNARLPPQLFFAAVEQAPAAISITDSAANILYVNSTFEQVTGYPRDEVLGHNESLLSDKRTPRHVYESLWACLGEQKVWTGKLLNRRKDGEPYLAEITITPVIDEGGTTRHYLGIHRDISDVHRLEQQVLNQKQRIETIVDAAPVVIGLLDESGRLVLDNMAYKALAADVGGEPALAIIGDPPHTLDPQQSPLFTGREVCFDSPASGAPRWFSCSASWISALDERADAFFRPRERRYLLVVAQEVTSLKQQQDEIRRNALRALVAEEAMVQGMREAIAAASFRMQGPFNLLRAALALVERRAEGETGEAGAQLRGVLNQALAAGQETLDMLRHAMPSANREPLVRVDLNQLLRDVLSLVTERMLALGVEVVWRPAASLPALPGYENQLRAIIKQLFDNALDAMDSNAVRRRELTIATKVESDVIQVLIEDSGPGIPNALRFKVFEPFFTTRNGARHIGTGLSMVQEVVNQLGGTVWLESVAQGGCRVLLQFPTVREALPSSPVVGMP